LRFRRHLCSRCRQLVLRLQHPRPLTHRQRCRDLSLLLHILQQHLVQHLHPRLCHLLLCLRLRLRHRPQHTRGIRHPCDFQYTGCTTYVFIFANMSF
jgi:hypothetical protein